MPKSKGKKARKGVNNAAKGTRTKVKPATSELGAEAGDLLTTTLKVTIPPRFRNHNTGTTLDAAESQGSRITPPPPVPPQMVKDVRKAVKGLCGIPRALRSSNFLQDVDNITSELNKQHSGKKRKAAQLSERDSEAEVDELASDNASTQDNAAFIEPSDIGPESSEGGYTQQSEISVSEEEQVDELASSSESEPSVKKKVLKKPIKAQPAAERSRKNKKNRASSEEHLPPEPIKELMFSIPHDGANTKIPISVDVSWLELQGLLADIFSIPPKDVRVAYRFSSSTRTTAIDAIGVLERSRRQDNDHKKFLVEIKDTREQQKVRKESGKKKQSKKKRVAKGSSSDSSATTSSDDESGPVNTDKVKKKKKSAPQWMETLEKDNYCPDHNTACYKAAGREHRQYARNKLSLWAVLLTKDYPSTTNPPPALKIADNNNASRSNPKTPARKEGANASAPPPYPFSYPPPMPPFPPAYYPYPLPSWASPMPGPTMPHILQPTSSSPPEAHTEDISIFPLITNWLVELDSGLRGVDKRNFAQYAQKFIDEEFLRVCDITDLSAEEIVQTCPGMPMGTARKILDYARKDTESIQKQQQKKHGRRR